MKNHIEAARLYRLAAEQGNATAQFELGVMYYAGAGIAEDKVVGHMWINIAASTGHQQAIENRDFLIESFMEQHEIEEAQRLATECSMRKFKGCGR